MPFVRPHSHPSLYALTWSLVLWLARLPWLALPTTPTAVAPVSCLTYGQVAGAQVSNRESRRVELEPRVRRFNAVEREASQMASFRPSVC
jgi:hypothetical protein